MNRQIRGRFGRIGNLTGTAALLAVEDISSPVSTVIDAYDKISLYLSTGARGVGTFTGQPGDTETVLIDGRTYTFQAALTEVDGNVLIVAAADNTLQNLVDAINLTNVGDGPGTGYAAGMTANTSVRAVIDLDANTITVYSLIVGAAALAIAITETAANFAWDGATMGAVASPITVTVDFSPDGTNWYEDNTVVHTDVNDSITEYTVVGTNMRITGNNVMGVQAQIFGAF